MNRRAPVKKQHERAVMLDFLEWYNGENDTDFAIYSEPDPPDALIKDSEVKRWLEVADAFYSNEWAKTQMSHVTPGEENHSWGGGRQLNMDEQIANRCVGILRKKLTKKTYKPFAAELGRDILLVTLQYPWLSAETFEDIDRCCSKADWSCDLMCFSDVYLVYPSMNRKEFTRWQYA